MRLKITIEADNLPEPMIVEKEVITWHISQVNDYEELEYASHTKYILRGSTFAIDYEVPWVDG